MQRVSVGPCFACGEMGHLRMYCPKIQTQEKKSVESVYVCGEYRELCCRNIVGVEREVLLIVVLVMSIQPVRLAIREGTGDLKTPFLCECTA